MLTMFHIVLGWQAGVWAQIEANLGAVDCTTKKVTQAYRDCYRELAKKPTGKAIQAMFAALWEKMVHSDEGLQRWVACLVLARTWRDEVKTTEQIERTIRLIDSYE